MKGFAIIGALLILAACAPQDPILFDGEEFKSKSKPVSDDKRVFLVEVRDAAGREDAAVKAARYEATLYCMGRFATSDMVWTAETDEIVLTESGEILREGECVTR